MNRIIISIFLFIFFAFPLSAQQDYKLDTTFKIKIPSYFSNYYVAGLRTQILEDANKMIYLVGGGRIFGASVQNDYQGIQRFFPDGTFDESFYLRQDLPWYPGAVRYGISHFHRNQFYHVNGHIVRLLNDGSNDTTLHTGNLRAKNILWINDSTFLAAGYRKGIELDSLYLPYSRVFLCHLQNNKDVEVDTVNFAKEAADGNLIRHILMQGDNFLVVGLFNTYGGYESPGIVRLLPNGKVDTTFKSPFDFGAFGLNAKVQSNGKIIVTLEGSFSDDTLTSYTPFLSMRLLPNGEIDRTFHIYKVGRAGGDLTYAFSTNDGGFFGVNGMYPVDNYVPQPVNQVNRLWMMKFDSLGFYDNRYCNTQYCAISPSFENKTSVRLSSGKILVAGSFDCVFPNSDYKDVVRIEEPDFQLAASDVEKEKALLKIYPNPASDELTIELPPNLQSSKLTLRLHNQLGQTVHSQTWREESLTQTISVASLPSGFYVVSVGNGAETWYQKVIVQR